MKLKYTLILFIIISTGCSTTRAYHNINRENINYDCTEVALKAYYEKIKENKNVEIHIGVRSTTHKSWGTGSYIGHTWLYINNKIYDPIFKIFPRKRYLRYSYTTYIRGKYSLKIILKEQEFHKQGYDAYVKFTRNRKTKRIKPYVVYKKNSTWIDLYIPK